MDNNNIIGDGLKKILLAGVGAVAITGEKSQQLIDELVKKGELTVDQGKILNKELRHDLKVKSDEAKEKAQAAKTQAEEDQKKEESADELAQMIKGMSADQIAMLKNLLEKASAKDEAAAAADPAPAGEEEKHD